jgi:hypothetical protein
MMKYFEPWQLAVATENAMGSNPLAAVTGYTSIGHETLADIFRCVYLASLRTEEGRTLRFSLLLCSPDQVDRSSDRLTEFIEPRPLNVEELRRLAAAACFPVAQICVLPLGGGSRIWGIRAAESEWQRFERGEQTSVAIESRGLTVTVTGPGSLSVGYIAMTIFTVAGGELVTPPLNVMKFGPIHDFLRPSMSALLGEAFPGDPTFGADPHSFISYGGEYLRFLVRTLVCAQDFGHGAAIFVVREEDAAIASKLLSIKYQTVTPTVWSTLVTYVTCVFEEIESSKLVRGPAHVEGHTIKTWRGHAERLEKFERATLDLSRSVAALTQVDGALVITDRLRVLGFGAVVREVCTRQDVGICKDERGSISERRRLDSYGTRHRSAVSLCESLDCVAFVLSQDGGVKAVGRAGDAGVVVWPAVCLDSTAWFVTAEDTVPQLRERFLNRFT